MTFNLLDSAWVPLYQNSAISLKKVGQSRPDPAQIMKTPCSRMISGGGKWTSEGKFRDGLASKQQFSVEYRKQTTAESAKPLLHYLPTELRVPFTLRQADILSVFDFNGTRTSNYLFQLLNQIVCGGELSNATAGQGGGNINNNQLSRLEILEAMLQRNAKILFAPNVTVVEEVISKANETLALVYELNEFVQTAAEILNKSGSQNDTYAAIKKVVLSPRTREFVKKYFGENALPNLLPRVSHKNQTKILEKWISAANQQGMDASYPSFIGFKNESMLEAFAKDADQEDITVVAGIVFDNLDEKNKTLGPVVNYKIRQKPSFTPSTEAVRDLFAVFAGPRDWDDSYYSYGFLWLQ
ncbi:hypothetical protein ANCDUO_23571, partial [Ancylostoma duodenale]